MRAAPILWYFADPMCSWCWGFAPVMQALRDAYRERLQFALMLGGLRPGTQASMTAALRAEILHHWHAVAERTGQPFVFDGALPEGFVYDTEPACRAVVAVGELAPAVIFDYFHSVQHAFYAEGRDVTQATVLTDLAQRHGIGAATFLVCFESPAVQRKTRAHFERTRARGVRAFPTVVLQREAEQALLSTGYRPLAELQPLIEQWLGHG